MVKRSGLPDTDPAPPDDKVQAAFAAVVGRLPDDLDEAFDILAEAADSEPRRFAESVAASAQERGALSGLSIINDEWLVCGVLADGRLAHADPAMLKAAEQPAFSEALAELGARAGRGARAFHVLPFAPGRRAIAVAAQARDAALWPLPPAARGALAGPDPVAVLVFAPAYDDDFAAMLARAFLLTPAEARVCGALFDGGTVEAAAGRLAIAPATAREHVRTILRKTGSSRRAGLIARITELMAGDYLRSSERTTLLREAFGLTAAEARVADAAALGLTVPAIARRDGVSAHTVRSQLDAALTKTGAAGAPAMARLVCELCALAAWTSCSEHRRLGQQRLIGATRLIAAPGKRQVAAADYGPADGTPVLYFPPGYCYRWVRRALAGALMAQGFRPMAVDPPDFGLTDGPPPDAGHFFDAAADDAARVLQALKVRRTHIFAEFGGSGPAMAFAARYPGMVAEAVLLMPRAPSQEPIFPGPIERVWRALAQAPVLTLAVYEALRTGGGSRYLRWVQTRISSAVEADRLAMADQDFVDGRIGEMTACTSRTARGMVALDRAFLAGWPRPERIGGARWTIVSTDVEPFRSTEPAEQLWGWLPQVRFVKLAGAGRLATHTHAAQIAALFGPGSSLV